MSTSTLNDVQASEAGTHYLPVAWMAGGQFVYHVQDRNEQYSASAPPSSPNRLVEFTRLVTTGPAGDLSSEYSPILYDWTNTYGGRYIAFIPWTPLVRQYTDARIGADSTTTYHDDNRPLVLFDAQSSATSIVDRNVADVELRGDLIYYTKDLNELGEVLYYTNGKLDPSKSQQNVDWRLFRYSPATGAKEELGPVGSNSLSKPNHNVPTWSPDRTASYTINNVYTDSGLSSIQFSSLTSAALFTEGDDVRNLGALTPGNFELNAHAASAALGGNDAVTLPSSNFDQWSLSAGAPFSAGPGNDTITGGTLGDHILGGTDNDSLLGGLGNDILIGGPGNDTILGGEGYDSILGALGNDSILAGQGNDTVVASSGNDTVSTGKGGDTFDYQAGAFAGFIGFASGTQQVLDGGPEDRSKGEQDVLKLPGSANDYRFSVSFGGTWAETTTTVETLTGSGLPSVSLITRGIETATFQTPVDNVVKLTANSLVAEMALLTKEVYGPLPTLEHKAELLASAILDVPLSTDPVTARAVTERNWHAVSALELGMRPAYFTTADSSPDLAWSFVGGHYAAYRPNPDPIGLVIGDKSEANAMVLVGDVPEYGKSLVIVFRGTDQWADFATYRTFANYYGMYKPLIDGLRDYVDKNPDLKILVAGHSLGAGASHYFLNEDFLKTNANVSAWTYGSPGAEVAGNTSIYNFVHTEDAITKVPFLTSGTEVANAVLGSTKDPLLALTLGATMGAIGALVGKSRTGSDIVLSSDVGKFPWLSEHAQSLYVQDILKLSNYANDLTSPFYDTAFAAALRDSTPYAGPSVQIGLGQPHNLTPSSTREYLAPSPYWSTIRAHRGDQYVLAGNEEDATNRIVIDAANLRAVGPRHIDGGAGKDTLVLPDEERRFQASVNGKGIDLTAFGSVSVGTLYRIEEIAYRDKVVALDGRRLIAQSPAPGLGVFQLASGFDYADAGDGTATVLGTESADTVYLGKGSRSVSTGAGDDTIIVKPQSSDPAGAKGKALSAEAPGPGDSVVIDGGPGADVMIGGTGNETFYVDSAGDEVQDDGGADTVVSAISYVLPDSIEALILTGEALSGTGNPLDNTLQGNAQDNQLISGQGNDLVLGAEGNDTLFGGKGDDTLRGASGNDLELGGQGADWLYGGVGDDTLQAGLGNDQLFGGVGTDRLEGGGGDDTLSGGANGDLFLFATGAGADLIADFSVTEGDRIGLAGIGLASTASTGAGALLTLADGSTITLLGVDANSLSSAIISL